MSLHFLETFIQEFLSSPIKEISITKVIALYKHQILTFLTGYPKVILALIAQKNEIDISHNKGYLTTKN